MSKISYPCSKFAPTTGPQALAHLEPGEYSWALTSPSPQEVTIEESRRTSFCDDGAFLQCGRMHRWPSTESSKLVEQRSRSDHFFVGNLPPLLQRDTAGGYAMSDERVFVLRLEKPRKALKVSRFTLSGLQNGIRLKGSVENRELRGEPGSGKPLPKRNRKIGWEKKGV